MTVESSRAYVWASAPPCYRCPLPPAPKSKSWRIRRRRRFASLRFLAECSARLAHTRAILRARRGRHAWRHHEGHCHTAGRAERVGWSALMPPPGGHNPEWVALWCRRSHRSRRPRGHRGRHRRPQPHSEHATPHGYPAMCEAEMAVFASGRAPSGRRRAPSGFHLLSLNVRFPWSSERRRRDARLLLGRRKPASALASLIVCGFRACFG
jgi:hypothetical protein